MYFFPMLNDRGKSNKNILSEVVQNCNIFVHFIKRKYMVLYSYRIIVNANLNK